ncbi:DUF4255 domain-containing protein [Streptomyces sp. NBC_01387]|uniref:DUF4255 domain-containing protein n=1 Tax=unclassified Streptomyces TaxID=2593676 RepID=UPI0020246169|nr:MULTISPECIES: DUF4255 domain-containing protein [unclassified Streptomyces]MCX4549394.1 DUF4255 domain-containing protein [Streptomyces sp. NBC_01500]WSC20931.1 DUF4255 domain-containing protein [Streptomyces sp. NBC_01766]WSV54939.1 DUF4255 domain-containing protein [Streptomyces sp. NBC_01014]
MIHEVDELLRTLLKGGALTGADIEIAFEAPTREWAARRNAPAFDVYLYDIREDVRRRERGLLDVRDERGVVVRRRKPPHWFRLSYLITAWTKRPEDEHRLLSAALATLLPHELIPPEKLPAALAELGLSVPLAISGIQMESRSLAEIWSALGGGLKPSLDIVVTVPFPAYPDYDAGPPVTEGAVVRAREMDGPLEDEERGHQERHKVWEAPDPGGVRASAAPVRFGAGPR